VLAKQECWGKWMAWPDSSVQVGVVFSIQLGARASQQAWKIFFKQLGPEQNAGFVNWMPHNCLKMIWWGTTRSDIVWGAWRRFWWMWWKKNENFPCALHASSHLILPATYCVIIHSPNILFLKWFYGDLKASGDGVTDRFMQPRRSDIGINSSKGEPIIPYGWDFS
jgi:hypothetical protein